MSLPHEPHARQASSSPRATARRAPLAMYGQRGMAVIAALIVVAAVTTIAAMLMQRQGAYVQAVQTALVRAQLQAALHGGLLSAERQLRSDAERDARTHRGGLWAQPIVDTRLADVRQDDRPGPIITAQLQDEQGKLNLRSLAFQGRLDMALLEQVRKLCGLVGLEPSVADLIAQRILVSQPEANGVTEDEGARKREGVLAAAPIPRGLDDLRSVPGLDPAAIERLRPHLTLLPNATLVNVNTASPEVIAAIVPGLALDRARTLVAQRDGGQWFIDQTDFLNRLNMPELATNSVRIVVQSNWFQFVGAARLDQSIMLLHALLLRGGAEVHTIWSREGA
ncbi:general secretion pathway protein K [Bordetella ansorpii]|uniref:Type II secretion system protein K n=1 Tax=Bordetella ansorpii TaxID=288768 RepID=A0A157QL61_9BORD|nr:type II secretion system minor pseudopilin GspK [Bordetella ansorpii]SAI46266.1 general secretion pathway protein K [Bordetella ansorpii]